MLLPAVNSLANTHHVDVRMSVKPDYLPHRRTATRSSLSVCTRSRSRNAVCQVSSNHHQIISSGKSCVQQCISAYVVRGQAMTEVQLPACKTWLPSCGADLSWVTQTASIRHADNAAGSFDRCPRSSACAHCSSVQKRRWVALGEMGIATTRARW